MRGEVSRIRWVQEQKIAPPPHQNRPAHCLRKHHPHAVPAPDMQPDTTIASDHPVQATATPSNRPHWEIYERMHVCCQMPDRHTSTALLSWRTTGQAPEPGSLAGAAGTPAPAPKATPSAAGRMMGRQRGLDGRTSLADRSPPAGSRPRRARDACSCIRRRATVDDPLAVAWGTGPNSTRRHPGEGRDPVHNMIEGLVRSRTSLNSVACIFRW
jgi:hypothetical protein